MTAPVRSCFTSDPCSFSLITNTFIRTDAKAYRYRSRTQRRLIHIFPFSKKNDLMFNLIFCVYVMMCNVQFKFYIAWPIAIEYAMGTSRL